MIQAIDQNLLDVLGMRNAEIKALASWANDTFLVEFGGKKLVVKDLFEYGIKETELEGAYRQYLNANDFPVEKFMHFDDGYVYSVRSKNYVVCEYIEGDLLKDFNFYPREIGGLLATLHLLNSSTLEPRKSWIDKTFIPSVLKTMEKENDDEYLSYKNVFESYTDMNECDLPYGLVHGDISKTNVIVASGKVVSILDWEESGIYPLILDMGRAISQLAVEDGVLDEEYFLQLIGAYQENRKLTEDEKKYLQDATNISFLRTGAWSMKKIYEGFITREDVAQWDETYRSKIILPKF